MCVYVREKKNERERKEEGRNGIAKEEEEKTRFAPLSFILSPLSVKKRCVSLMMRRGRAAAAISTSACARPASGEREKRTEREGAREERKRRGKSDGCLFLSFS